MSSDYKGSSYNSNNNVGDLQYDDSAFWYYSLAILSVALISLSLHLLRKIFGSSSSSNTEVQIPNTPHFQKKLDHILSRRKNSGSSFKKLVFLGVIVYFWSVCFLKALEAKDFKSFDPFALLDIESSANEKEIKKAYRTLVKKYHPDRNPGDREAYNKFLQITKAYQCLTDPETKETCAKFGNPDGNSSFEVGVALPSFFLKKENTKLVLTLFFIMLFFGTLIYLISLQSNVDLNEFGVSRRTLQNSFVYFKNENMIFKNVVEMMSISEELRPVILTKSNQMKDMRKLQDTSLKTSMSKKEFQIFKKPFYLIHHHMRNDEKTPDSLQKDLLLIQEKSLGLFVSLFELGIELVQLSKHHKRIWEKPLSPRVLETLCKFAQHFTQGMFQNESQLLQLPFIDRANVKRISNKMKINSVKEILPEDSEKREKLLGLVASNDQERKELVDALDCFSQFEVKIGAFVDLGENQKDLIIRKNDIFTFEIEITRKNPSVGYIYSKKLDFLKLERISVLVYFKKNKHILHYETKFTKERTLTISFKREIPAIGEFELIISVESDSYVGVGVEREFTLKVEKPQENEDLYQLHPDDEEALTKPSFIMSLLNGALEDEENSDDEFEDEPEDENPKTDETPLKSNESEDDIKETK